MSPVTGAAEVGLKLVGMAHTQSTTLPSDPSPLVPVHPFPKLQFCHLPMSLGYHPEKTERLLLSYPKDETIVLVLLCITCRTGAPTFHSQFYCTSDLNEGTENPFG